MKRLLVVKQKGTELCLNVTEESEIVKKIKPILWYNEGLYGWIPFVTVRNEVINLIDRNKIQLSSDIIHGVLRFTWLQVRGIPKDIGEILMAFAEEQND